MKRRDILLGLTCLATMRAAAAQSAGALRVGWLTVAPNPYVAWFRRGMEELGYREGQNFTLVARDAGNQPDRLSVLTDDLVRDGVSVIVAVGGVAARRVLVATQLPVVTIAGDPVAFGISESYARPARNITGVATSGPDFAAKWVEYLSEAVPGPARVGVLYESHNDQMSEGHVRQLETMRPPADVLRKILVPLQVDGVAAIEPIFTAMQKDGIVSTIVLSSAFFHAHKDEIIRAANNARVATMYEHRDFTEAGGLISYGPDFRQLYRRLAYFVDRIAKGARPQDLPIERPDRYELIVNMKAARATGIQFAPAFIARADEVIE